MADASGVSQSAGGGKLGCSIHMARVDARTEAGEYQSSKLIIDPFCSRDPL